MSTVEEIERAIEKLPAPDLARLRAWISQRDNEEWDRQLEEDSASGRLEFLAGLRAAREQARRAEGLPAEEARKRVAAWISR